MHIVFCTTIGLLALALIVAGLVGVFLGIGWLIAQSQAAVMVANRVGKVVTVAVPVIVGALLVVMVGFALLSGAHDIGCRIIKLF
jgi:ABC-type dipeptide/oligopeptide/nickel transport system permease component